MQMKVYVIKATLTDWDQYDEITVIAESPEAAIEEVRDFFEKIQLPLTASFICDCNATQREILTTSFCAG